MAEYLRNATEYAMEARSVYLEYLVNILILLIGFIIGKLAGKIAGRILHELEVDSILKKAAGISINIEHKISVFVTYIIYFITIIIFLNNLGVTTTVLQIIFAAVVAIIIISLLLATKDFIPNAFAGFYIYRRKIIDVGDRVSIRGVKGEVTHINLLETKLRTKEGDMVYIPNSAVAKTGIVKLKKRKKV